MEYEDIGNDFFRERNHLLQWNSSVPILSATFPGLPNDCALVKFRFSSKMALSRKNNCTAILTPDGELRFVIIKDGTATLKCHLIVQLDPYPEYCMLEWSNSESLLILTQSDGKINVFEPNGGFCYSLVNQVSDSSGIITEIRSVAIENDDQFLDYLYVMQLNSQLYVFKLGKSNYELSFSVNLGLDRSFTFIFLPTFNLVIASTEYTRTTNRIKGLSGSDIGLNVFRVFEEFPFVECIKKSISTSKWKKVKQWMPLYDRNTSIVSIDANMDYTFLVAISSIGDIFVMNIPSLTVVNLVFVDQIKLENQPMQIKWSANKISILHKNGIISQTSVEQLDLMEDDSVIVPDCAAIDWNSEDSFIAYTEQELSNENRLVSQSDYVNRFWFFTIFRISFIYQWIKLLGGALVGEPIESINNSGFERTFAYTLYEIRKISRLRFIEKLLSKKDYEYATKLALDAEDFDMDLIYKRQWLDMKEEANEEAVRVLEKVGDKAWLVHECLTCQKEELETQQRLITLAESVMDEVDECLRKGIYTAKVIFDSLPKHLIHDSSLYLRFRSSDLLRMTCTIAKEGRIEILQYIVMKYINFLHEYMLLILSLIPESIPPKSYVSIIPFRGDLDDAIVFNTKNAVQDLRNIELSPDTLKADELAPFMPYLLTGNERQLFEKWCEDRVRTIDLTTGIVNHSISLLEIVVEHGFEEMKGALANMSIFRNFINFSSNVSLSYDQFLTVESSYIRDAISKHMKEEDLQENIEQITEIFEKFHPESAKKELFYIVQSHSQYNLNVLTKLVQIKPSLFTEEELVSIFCETTLTGESLVESLEKFNMLSKFSRLLSMFNRQDFQPTFLQLYNSFASKTLAEQMFHKFITRGAEKSNLNWPSLLFQAQDIQSFYSDLLTKHEVNAMVVSEMLFFFAENRFVNFPLDLVVDFRQNHAHKLSLREWEDIIVQKCQEFIERAMPVKNDPNLDLARAVIKLLPDKHMSNSVRQIINHVSVIEMSIDLGLPRLPATYRFCDPENLLQEVAGIEKNYKQVKKCAELAKLLGIKTPAAKAMVCCAQEALKAQDFSVFERYIRQLLKTAKGLSGIYHLCKEARACKEVSHLEQELVTCMILNCPTGPNEEILEVLDATRISNLKEVKKDHASTEMLIDDMFLLDSMYASIGDMHRVSSKGAPNIPKELLDCLSEACPSTNCDEIVHNFAREWLTCSVTVALFVDLLAETPSNSDLTKNNLLRKLIQSLQKLQEIGKHQQLTTNLSELTSVIERLPTGILLKIGNEQEQAGVSAIERILETGIERERFFEDSIYRSDSLFSLISMTKDEQLIGDVLEVADQFHLSKWELLIALLKYLLNDDEVSPAEAKAIMKTQKLHEHLWLNLEQLYSIMRDSVLSQLPEKDVNKLKLYLTFFKSPEREFDFLKCLPHIQAIKSNFPLKNLLYGEVNSWFDWIKKAFEMDHDEDILANIRFIKKLPNIEEIASRFLGFILTKNISSSRAIRVLFYLMEKRDDLLIDEVSHRMDPDKESDYWTLVLNEWSFKDKYESRLETKIRRRIEVLKNRISDSRSVSSSPGPEEPKFEMKRRKQ